MAYKIFHIPVMGDSEAEEMMNAFLRTHRIVDVRQYLVTIMGRTLSVSSWNITKTVLR